MTVAQLRQVRAAAVSVAGKRGIHPFDFIIYNEPRVRDQLRLMGRGLAHKAYWAVTSRSR
jgi:hydroxyacylglutathione hydrolase